MLGIDCDLEALLKAKPGSKEVQILKFFKEAKERAETLARINRDLDKKMSSLMNNVDKIRRERLEMDRKYRDVFENI